MSRTLAWPLSLEWDIDDYNEYVAKMSAWAAELSIEPGNLEMIVFQLAANGDPQNLWSAPELFASTPTDATIEASDSAPDGVLTILDRLHEAAAMFAALSGDTDADDIPDFERGVRELERIVLTQR